MTTTLVVLSFLLFALTTNLNLQVTTAASVLDTEHQPLENNGDYYILPSFDETHGGGVRYPLAVVLSPSEGSLGFPLSISSTNGTMIILTDDVLSVKFTNFPNKSPWMLVKDDSAHVWYVDIANNAEEDYPNTQIMRGWFQIKEYNSDYKLIFCTALDCEDVGIYTDSNGNCRLAHNGAAFAVKFKNADESARLFKYE